MTINVRGDANFFWSKHGTKFDVIAIKAQKTNG